MAQSSKLGISFQICNMLSAVLLLASMNKQEICKEERIGISMRFIKQATGRS